MQFQERLPEYIWNRKKIPLSEGAGFSHANRHKKGLFYETVMDELTSSECEELFHTFRDWNLQSCEDAYYFRIYRDLGYCVATFHKRRCIASLKSSNE